METNTIRKYGTASVTNTSGTLPLFQNLKWQITSWTSTSFIIAPNVSSQQPLFWFKAGWQEITEDGEANGCHGDTTDHLRKEHAVNKLLFYNSFWLISCKQSNCFSSTSSMQAERQDFLLIRKSRQSPVTCWCRLLWILQSNKERFGYNVTWVQLKPALGTLCVKII